MLDVVEAKPADADKLPSELVESADSEIVRLAALATSGVVPPGSPPDRLAWASALAIERFVHGYLDRKNYSQAFHSAAEVARTRSGDCTEHAVLVCALCRASRIPARVAYGLVYVASEQAFAFHMWSEAWIADRWIPLDATLGLGGIGAGHLKCGDSSLSDRGALLRLLPLMQAVGKLRIDVGYDAKPR